MLRVAFARLTQHSRPTTCLSGSLPMYLIPALEILRKLFATTPVPKGLREVTPELAEKLLRTLPKDDGEEDDDLDPRSRGPASKRRTTGPKVLEHALSLETVLGSDPATEAGSQSSKGRTKTRQLATKMKQNESLDVAPTTASLDELEKTLEELAETERRAARILEDMQGVHKLRRQGDVLVRQSNSDSEQLEHIANGTRNKQLKSPIDAEPESDFGVDSKDNVDVDEEMDDSELFEDDYDDIDFDELSDHEPLPEEPQRIAQTIGGEGIYTFELREEDLMEQFIRGSGPGGQSVNRTRNCVYLKHVPTGTVVKCQQTRSLTDNRNIARKIMALKLQALKLGPNSKQAIRAAKIRKRKQRNRRRHLKKHGGVHKEESAGETESVNAEGAMAPTPAGFQATEVVSGDDATVSLSLLNKTDKPTFPKPEEKRKKDSKGSREDRAGKDE